MSSLRLFALLSLPLLSPLLAGFPLVAHADAPAPVIAFDESTFDFGAVKEGPPVKHLFKVRNKGNAPLEIKHVSASCGCTAAVTKDKVIKPGGSGEIEVSFNTAGRPGKNVKTVTVSSNDPKTPSATLTINVDVERLIGFEPGQSFLSGQQGQKLTAEVWLAGKLADKAKLRLVKLDPPRPLTVELTERKAEATKGQASGRGIRIRHDGKQAGSGTVRVMVDTGVKEQPQIVHVVYWAVQGNPAAPGPSPDRSAGH